MAMALDSINLNVLFRRGFDLHSEVCKSSLDSRSAGFQGLVKKTILILEDATRLVSVLDIFSRNERVEEVPTEHLKFFLLPVLLGDMNGKLQETGTDREEIIRIQEVYYKDFLQRCNDYGICQVDLDQFKEAHTDEEEDIKTRRAPPDLAKMNQERELKLKEYREMKDIETRLEELKELMKHPSADEDVVKEFYLKTIKKFAKLAMDELKSFDMEKGILKHMKLVKAGKVPEKSVAKEKRRPLKPIIITKDKIQKEVFGLGYKNVPIMSIEEFYDQRVKDGWFPDPEQVKQNKGKALQDMTDKDLKAEEEQEAAEKEKKEEEEDEEELQRKRNWDEYRDDHRRGEGNRHNMG